ncbi:hypothetical protein B5S29_g5288 [[Candida] boidinii]|nr:hypothetical protein B5S29_g5288 [[Candida] boidinii]
MKFCYSIALLSPIFLGLTSGLPIGNNQVTSQSIDAIHNNLNGIKENIKDYIDQLLPKTGSFDHTYFEKLENDDVYFDYIHPQAELAQLAYCINEFDSLKNYADYALKFPRAFASVTTINPEELLKFSSEKDEPLKRYQLVHVIHPENDENKLFEHGGGEGYILLDHLRETINIVFRGSRHMKQWISNLDFAPASFNPLSNRTEFWEELNNTETGGRFYDKYYGNYLNLQNIHTEEFKEMKNGLSQGSVLSSYFIHKGFSTVTNRVNFQTFSNLFQLLEEYPNYHVFFIGHSLGGALAQSFSLESKLMGIDNVAITFNAPSLFSRDLSGFYEKLMDNKQIQSKLINNSVLKLEDNNSSAIIRNYQFYDIVPRILPKELYKHAGAPIVAEKKGLPHNKEDFYLKYPEEKIDDEDYYDGYDGDDGDDDKIETEEVQANGIFKHIAKKVDKKYKITKILKDINEYKKVMHSKIQTRWEDISIFHKYFIVFYSACNKMTLD